MLEWRSLLNALAPKICVVTISDRAARGQYEDRGGPAVVEHLAARLAPGYTVESRLVADDQEGIEKLLIELADREQFSWIVTTGGTGPAPRDVTPEATRSILEKQIPGFGERMRAVSADQIPTAILSRQEAGIRGSTLIINLPGSPGAIRDCLDAVLPAIPHCLELLGSTGIRLSDGEPPLRHE